ncbi:MAG: hypothetical protein LWW99_12020 [Deltaproteobacteria bacterium]|nr:hypothetical protein [Deltaproteobacteria bacterium]
MVAKVLTEGKRFRLGFGDSKGHHREVVSLSADRQVKEARVQSYELSLPRTRSGGQEPHIRPSLQVRQHNMSKPWVQGNLSAGRQV